MTADHPQTAGSDGPPISRAHMIAAASIGNALEFYDFIVYGFFASAIAASFFPGKDPTAKLLLAFATFGIPFLARPVGAVVLGMYADRRGRSACMILCVSLMTLGGLMIALMPDLKTIGLAAPIGILVARLIQGFALGGEFGSATALMIEHSPNGETRAASWQGISQNLAGLMASGVAWALTNWAGLLPLHIEPFRIAFGIGVIGGPVALLLRRRLHDAPAYHANKHKPKAPGDPATYSGIAIAAGMIAIGTAQTYLVVYLPTYAATQLHMTAGSALGSVFLLYVATLALTPLRQYIAGHFDRSQRSIAMILSCVAMLAAGYPAFMILAYWPGPAMLFAIPLGFTVLGLCYNAPLSGFMGMVFAVRRRGIGLSLGYALGIALFGGCAPMINTWLVAKTGDPRSPGLYLIFAAAVTIVALIAARRRLPRYAR